MNRSDFKTNQFFSKFTPASSQAAQSEHSMALAIFLEQFGREVLLDPAALEAALRQSSLDPTLQLQLQLLAQVPGLANLVAENTSTPQNDLDRLVKNALATTGLNRSTIQELVASLCIALGYPVIVTHQQLQDHQPDGRAFVVPPGVYLQDLAAVRRKLDQGQELSQAEMQMLETLTLAGVNEAACFWGRALLPTSPGAALKILTQAAEGGSAEAQALIGDYYYSKGPALGYSMAQAIYTGYGAAALTPQRQENLRTVLNERTYNRKNLFLGGVLVLLMLLTTFFLSFAFPLGIPWVGFAATALCAALLGLHIYRASVRPYDSAPLLIPLMFALWCCYMLTWCLV